MTDIDRLLQGADHIVPEDEFELGRKQPLLGGAVEMAVRLGQS